MLAYFLYLVWFLEWGGKIINTILDTGCPQKNGRKIIIIYSIKIKILFETGLNILILLLWKFPCRLVQRKCFGSVFNFHLSVYFLMKGLLLPLSISSNIILLLSPDDDPYYCSVMRLTAVFGETQNTILQISSIIFRWVNTLFSNNKKNVVKSYWIK